MLDPEQEKKLKQEQTTLQVKSFLIDCELNPHLLNDLDAWRPGLMKDLRNLIIHGKKTNHRVNDRIELCPTCGEEIIRLRALTLP